MRSRWRPQVIVPLALAAAVYVLAGFWVDLPPYGLWLESARSEIGLQEATAEATVELRYRCTSWRPRGTVLYLPFAQAEGMGPATVLRAEVEEGWSWEAFPDGVLLRLRMSPGTSGRARFTFRQDCPGKVFRLPFPVTRDWGRPPSPAEWRLEAAPGVTAEVRPPAFPPGGPVQVAQGTTEQELEVRWR